MNLLGGLGTVLPGLFKLLGKGLNAIGIVLLALVELLVKVLQQSAGLALKVLKALLELISAILVGATKPFSGLVGRKQGSKGSSAANALGWVGGAVIVFFFASMISVLLPALFSNPGWYAGVLRGFVGNGGLLIFGLFCLCMAQTWPDGQRTRETSRGRNTWLGRMAAILYLLVLPGFTYISVLTWKQVDTNTRDQQAVLRQRRDEGLRQIAIASNPAPLRQLIQASGSPQPPPAASLDLVKQKASDVVLKVFILADEQATKQRREGQLGTLIECARILISSFTLAIASLALSQWSSSDEKSSDKQLSS
jgi:hypothetical protein